MVDKIADNGEKCSSGHSVLNGKYELGRQLGQGTFAKVYHARNLKSGKNVAMKVVGKEKVIKVGMMEQIKREISVMKMVKHPNIVELHEVLASKSKIYFAMELVRGGELFDKIAKGRLREDAARKYFQQLISAVDFCHSRGVYHRDLKPENLLLDDEGNLKVTDFGLSAFSDHLRQDGLLHTTCGTPAYVAPEVLIKKGYGNLSPNILTYLTPTTMAQTTTTTATQRYAVVTGANKGIGLEICRQLASHGIKVVLTSRDEKRGIEAIEKLKLSGLSDDHVVFHKLDVVDPTSVSSLADFIKTQFRKLDILVNNAGISGAIVDEDALKATLVPGVAPEHAKIDWTKIMKETYEAAEECLQTNYYGTKRMTEALIPLLQLSDSPRIVNISSAMGKLENLANEWAKGVLNDSETLTKERVDEILNEFLKDFKEGSLESRGWPQHSSAYRISKAAMNAYTRILAKKYPNYIVNCVCPGYVKTDLNFNTGVRSVEEGAATPVRLALLPDGGPSGVFFVRGEVSSFE